MSKVFDSVTNEIISPKTLNRRRKRDEESSEIVQNPPNDVNNYNQQSQQQPNNSMSNNKNEEKQEDEEEEPEVDEDNVIDENEHQESDDDSSHASENEPNEEKEPEKPSTEEGDTKEDHFSEKLFENEFKGSEKDVNFLDIWEFLAKQKINYDINMNNKIFLGSFISLIQFYIMLVFLQQKHKLPNNSMTDFLRLIIFLLSSQQDPPKNEKIPKQYSTVFNFFKTLGLQPLKFFCNKETKDMTSIVPEKKDKGKFTQILYYPIIQLIGLYYFLDSDFYSHYVVEKSDDCPNQLSRRIWTKFFNSPSCFFGLFSDGLKVFTSKKLEIWPAIGYLFRKTGNFTAKQDYLVSDFFVNSIFTPSEGKHQRIDHYYTILIDELLYLFFFGVKIGSKTIKVAQMFLGCDLDAKKSIAQIIGIRSMGVIIA